MAVESRVTISQIAAEAGVTAQTVSNVLRGRTRGVWTSSASRAEHIKAIAERLGYRPNSAARAVVSGRFHTAALVLSTEGRRSTLFPGLVTGAADALAERDMHLTIARIPDHKLTDEDFMPRALREWTADGLLINYNQEIPEKLVDLVARHRIPSIWINSKQPANCIYPDDFEGAKLATEKLIALGHRKITFANYAAPLHYSRQDRQDGYAFAMREAGLTPQFFLRPSQASSTQRPGDDLRQHGIDALSGEDRPTAVLTYSGCEATSILHAAAWLQLRVPTDLSVVSFGESVQDDTVMPLSKIWISRIRLGELAVDMLMQKINDPSTDLPPHALALKWWEGSTTAPVNGG